MVILGCYNTNDDLVMRYKYTWYMCECGWRIKFVRILVPRLVLVLCILQHVYSYDTHVAFLVNRQCSAFVHISLRFCCCTIILLLFLLFLLLLLFLFLLIFLVLLPLYPFHCYMYFTSSLAPVNFSQFIHNLIFMTSQ